MRIILIGDLHYDLKQPLKRIDSIKDTFKKKFKWLRSLKTNDKILYVCTGDIFNRPNPDVTVINSLIYEISTLPGDFVTTTGNHDMFNFDINSYNNTALNILEKALENFYVINCNYNLNEDITNLSEYSRKNILIIGRYFTNDIDNIENREKIYSAEEIDYKIAKNNNQFLLGIAHGMVIEKFNKFIKHTLVSDIKTNFDLLLTGHDHTGYNYQNKCYNPGSLYRNKIDEKDRLIKVGIIDLNFDDENKIFTQKFSESFFDGVGEFYEYKPIEILQDTKELIREKDTHSSNINLNAFIHNLDYDKKVKEKAVSYLKEDNNG